MKKIVLFGSVGALASLAHYATATILLSVVKANLYIANVFGFFLAIPISYCGHYYLSFQSRKGHAVALARFVFVAIIGLAINNLALSCITLAVGRESHLSLLSAIAIAATAVYLLSRNWVFASPAKH